MIPKILMICVIAMIVYAATIYTLWEIGNYKRAKECKKHLKEYFDRPEIIIKQKTKNKLR